MAISSTINRVPSRRMILLFGLFILAYWIWILTPDFDRQVEQVLSSFLIIGVNLVASASGFALYRNDKLDSRVRRAWLLLALAFLSQGVAEIVYFFYESVFRWEQLFYVSYVFYFVYYGLIFAGVLQFPLETRENETRTIVWLDLAIIMTVSFMALWYFILTPLELISGDTLLTFQIISYPLAGSFVFAANVALIQRDLIKVTWWTLFYLGCGMFCSLIADGFLAYFEVNRIPYQMATLNGFWMLGPFFVLIAANRQNASLDTLPEQIPNLGSSRRFIRHVAPYMATIFGIGLLVLDAQDRFVFPLRSHGIVIGTIVLVGLVLLRQDKVLQENVRLYQHMQKIAITDSLTGIYNRHFLDEVLRNEVERSKRFRSALSILMIDVNGFKSYNDRFGHLKGDEALQKIASTLLSHTRIADFLGRFGGDEFIAILPSTDRTGAEFVAGKIREAFHQQTFDSQSLDVSIGIATCGPETNVARLLQEADQDLYQNKRKVLR